MENKQIQELESLKDIDNKSSKSSKLTFGMFGGLMVTVVGLIMLLASQKGFVSSNYYSIGFKTGIAGIAIYWIFRLIYLYKTKLVKKSKFRRKEDRDNVNL